MIHNEQIFIRQLQLGPMANFVYLVGCPEKRQCVVIDPAWEIPVILNTVEGLGYELVGALGTHYHPDHVGGHIWGHDIPGFKELKEKVDIPLYAHKNDAHGISQLTDVPLGDFRLTEGGDTLEVGNINIKILHTPGHTPGSQCFLVGDKLLAGDTLFISGCGRVDLPGGNQDDLECSLKNVLGKLPGSTILYPGHHYDPEESAELSLVAQKNPYFHNHFSSDEHKT